MWRYPFFNLCFVIFVITLLSVQHSATVFGPTGHIRRVTRGNHSEGSGFTLFTLDGESPRSLSIPAEFSHAAAFLTDIWRRGRVFNEWLMEYNASQWEIFRASSPTETDLLEARFHIANAEVFTDAMSESDRAIKELDRAAISLQEVQTLVKPNLAPQLTTLNAEITAAEMIEKKGAVFSTAPFETIEANLDHLIEVLRVS
jgi:hypothetical protein